MLALRGIRGGLCSVTKSARMALPRGGDGYLQGPPAGQRCAEEWQREIHHDDTLVLRSGGAEATLRWDTLVGYKMSDDIVLLYENKTAAQLVSRSLFASDEDWQHFRDYVRATVRK